MYFSINRISEENKPKTHLQGFTLIEILLVVFILSVVAAVAVPNFSRTYSNLELKRKTEDVAYLMKYAQSRSVAKRRPLRLMFDSEFEKYWLEEFFEDEGEEIFKRLTSRLGKTYKIPNSIQIQMEEPPVTFYPDGRIEKRRIYLCDKEKCFTISTKEQRGHVKVYDSKLE